MKKKLVSRLLNQLSFCRRSSVAVCSITCVYVKCLAEGSPSDQRQSRKIVKGKVHRDFHGFFPFLLWSD